MISDNLLIFEETKTHWGDNNPCGEVRPDSLFLSTFSDLITYHVPGWVYHGSKHSVPDHIGLMPRFSFISLLTSQQIVSNLEVLSFLDHS